MPPLPDLSTPTPMRGDAHVHLFNAADLPVVGFLRFVIIPEYLPHLPEVALALVDMAITVMKSLAPTANRELAGTPRDVTPEMFADRLARRMEGQGGSSEAAAIGSQSSSDTDASYAALRELVDASGLRPGSAEPRASADRRPLVDRAFLADVARRGREAARNAPPPSAAMARGSADLSVVGSAADVGALWDTIRWCYEMVLPRCRHFRDYLAVIADPTRRTDLIVNLLVDYDAWLGDSPSLGSSMTEQLRFWERFSRVAAPLADIRTFAGYDPLRHAEDRLTSGGGSTYWEALKAAALGGGANGPAPLAAGFKIYPPMGFRVFGNSGLEPAADRSGLLVRERWTRKGWPLRRFGDELDASLAEFFDFCTAQGVPVMAHGRHSQEASSDTGECASPRYWHERALAAERAKHRPVRACIAHWSDTDEFRTWMPRILELNHRGVAEIYFDLAYSEQFLDGEGVAFLETLARTYEPADPEGRYMLFGSDWIMLGREPSAQRYAAAVTAAVQEVPFWQDRAELLFHENLRRFLERPSRRSPR